MAVIQVANNAQENEALLESKDLGLRLRKLLAPILGIDPSSITPADIENFRKKHVYQGRMNLDTRSGYGGFIAHRKRCLTEQEIEDMRKESDEFAASLGH